MTDHHQSARQLIIQAVESSSLLREIAELLWFAAEHGNACCAGGACAPCELRDRLIDKFDSLVCLPAIVGEEIFSPDREGVEISPPPARAPEVDRFIG